MFKKSGLGIIGVIFSLIWVISAFAQETFTITTYYPSPYGTYQDLNVARNLTLQSEPVASNGPQIQWRTSNVGTDRHWNIDQFGDRLRFFTERNSDDGAGVERMTILENGNVGIGTANPGVKLDVNVGSGILFDGIRVITNRIAGGLRLQNTNGGKEWFIDTTGSGSIYGSGKLVFYPVGSSLAPLLMLSQDADWGTINVGIGGPAQNHRILSVWGVAGKDVHTAVLKRPDGYGVAIGGIGTFNYGGSIQGTKPRVPPAPLDIERCCGDLLLNGADNNTTVIIGNQKNRDVYGAYRLYVNGPAYATGGWQSSDLRLKKNVEKLSNVLKKLENVNAVRFDWRTDEFPDKGLFAGRQIGIPAQEVEKEFPELVNTDGQGYKAFAYDRFTAVLLEAIKEQQSQIESLKKDILELKAKSL